MFRVWTLALALLAFAGCASLQDYQYRKAQQWRAHVSWWGTKGELPKECADGDFGKGYRDGYVDRSMGGCGCLPAVPPPKYWSAKYQNPEGRCQIERYFAGWQAGVIAAESDGRNFWHRIPTKSCRQPCVPECENCFLNDQSIVSGSDDGGYTPEIPEHVEPNGSGT